MALINCPECGKEISDKSDKCIHCGFPINDKENTTCIINGKEYNLSFIFFENKLTSIKTFMSITNCGLSDAKKIVEEIINTNKIPKTLFVKEQVVEQDSNIPHCPTCSSTDLKKISTTSKVMNTAMWGIFGTKRHKTYHCNSCGYEW